MATFEPLQLFDALRASPRLMAISGMKVLFGKKSLAAGGGAPRIVLVPRAGAFVAPEDKDNLTDLSVTVECHVWGGDYDPLWSVICALVQAVQDFRTGNGVDAQYGDVEFDVDDDTSTAGVAAVVTFVVRAVVTVTPLPANAGAGTVTAIQYTRG